LADTPSQSDAQGPDASQAVQVHATESGPVRRTLEVEVAPERVDRAFERVYRELGRHARVKGFRPGKVPRSVIRKLHGGTAAEEVERLLVTQTLADAVEETGVQPVVEPAVEAPTPVEGEPFRYTVALEVKPEISLPELEGLPARRPRVEVDEAQVERELESLRQRNAPLVEEPEQVAAARGHVLTLDFEGRVDGQPFAGGTARGHELEIGAGRFVPGFEEQLEGARAGDDLQVRVTFPEDYGAADLAGRKAVFDVHVHAIRRRDLPALDDEFAKDVGDFETLDDLRERIRSELREAQERQAKTAVERSVMDALLERTAFEVGPGLVERQLRSRLQAAHRQLEGSVPHASLHEQLARWQEEWRPQAEREVRESLVLEAVAREQGLSVDDETLQARIEEMAARQGVDARTLRKAYEERGLFEGLRAQLLDEAALAWLVARAKVDEVPGT
jgi:trigger factor